MTFWSLPDPYLYFKEDVHPSLPILESLGLKELVAGNLLSQEENVVNIPLTNITHSARIQLSKVQQARQYKILYVNVN